MAWGSRKLGCFVCGIQGHFARSCPDQFCQQCGKRGHHRRDCKTGNRVLLADTSSGRATESGVVVRITLNGVPIVTMLDSGAQPSIVDKGLSHPCELNTQVTLDTFMAWARLR